MKTNGLFITIEGPDGAGKGTVIERLQDWISSIGLEFVLTKEPGSPKSEVCKMMRNFVLNPEYKVYDEAEIFMYMADRCQHVNEVVIPALSSGKIVICDRYIDSTYAYQGWGRRCGEPKAIDQINYLNNLSTSGLLPDMTLLLLVDPEIGLSRIKNSKREREFGQEFDRIEKEKIEFHKRVHMGYMNLMSPEVKGDRKIFCFDTTNTSSEDCWLLIKDMVKNELTERKFI